jgi:DNA repair exonuclease SbcCD ATPase subunit
MLQLSKIELDKIVTFGNASVDVTGNNGFVVVQGINHDSSIVGNNNGAGKSLLFSALPTAFYESDPLALRGAGKKAMKNKKDLHTNKGSKISAEFLSNSGQVIRYEQTGSKYHVLFDGKDQKAQTQDIARGKLFQHWTINEDEFYTTCYIQSQRPCSFQKAKPSDRLNFITEMFGLHRYDLLRKHFAKVKQQIKEKEIEYQTLAGQLQKIEIDLKGLKWDDKSASKLKRAKKKLDKLTRQLESLYEQRTYQQDDLKITEKLQKLFREYMEIIHDLGDYASHEPKELLKKLQSQLDHAEDLEDYEEDLAKHSSKKGKLQSTIDEIEGEVGEILEGLPGTLRKIKQDGIGDKLQDLVAETRTAEEKLDKYELQAEQRAEWEESYGYLHKQLKQLGVTADTEIPDELDEEISMYKASIRLAEELEEHKNCPTCMQRVDKKLLAKQARLAEKKLPGLVNLRKASKFIEELNELQELGKPDAVPEKRIKAAERKVNTLKKTIEDLERLERLYITINGARERLEDLVPPKKPKGKIWFSDLDADGCDDLIKDIEDRIAFEDKLRVQTGQTVGVKVDVLDRALTLVQRGKVKTAKSTMNKAITASLKEANARIDQTRNEIDGLKEDSRDLDSQVIRLETAKGNWSLLVEQQTEIKDKMAEAEPLIREKKIVELLYQAYGNTNLKLQQATKFLKLIESNLNRYSHLVFPEAMKFELLAGSRGVDALVTRKNGHTSDISKLSGAETNCFRLLFAVSIIPLLPSERRTNFIILDEPDSACSDAVREHIAQHFVPILRTLIPHVFWITPKPVDVFKEAEVWTVEKRNGKSSLHLGKN